MLIGRLEDLDDEWQNIISCTKIDWKVKNLRVDYCRLGFSIGLYHIWA